MRTHEESIRRLIYTYAELLDAADYEGMGELFQYATVHVSGVSAPVTGREDIRDFFDGMNHLDDNGSPGTRFMTSNTIVDVSEDGQSAKARSYFQCLQASSGVPLAPIAAGRYHDQFAKRDGEWTFTERRITLDLFGDMGHHVRFNPGTDTVDPAEVVASARAAKASAQASGGVR